MHVGTYEHTLDAKGRVSLPAALRKNLPTDLILVCNPTDTTLYVFAPDDFENWFLGLFEKSGGYNDRSRRDQAIRKRIMMSSAPAVIDSAGRVSIPETFRSYAGLQKEVTLIGDYDHIEIYDRAKLSEIDLDEGFADFFFED